MIENDAQLQQTREVLQAIEAALAALKLRVEPSNPELFRAMAESYVDDILRLRGDIDAFIGVSSALADRAPLWFVLEGTSLEATEISSRVLSDWLSKFRRAVQSVTEYLQTGRVRTTGRPSAELIDATDPRLVALAPGSVRIGLRFRSFPVQEDTFEGEARGIRASPRWAVERLLEMAEWVQSGNLHAPNDVFPDREEAAVIASELSDLVPSNRSAVRTVRFEGALVPATGPVTLRSEFRPRLRQLVQELSPVFETEAYGIIREIDLDAQRITLRERGPTTPDLKCFVPDDLMSVAEQSLDKMVHVKGIVSAKLPDTMDVTELSLMGPT